MDISLLKLKKMLHSRYGKGFELRPLMDMSLLTKTTETLISGNDLFIPIMVEEQFLGTAVIPHGWELCEDKRKGIAQLVRMILEPKLYNQFLERRESNLKCLQGLNFPETNLAVFGDDNTGETVDAVFEIDSNSSTTALIHLLGRQNQLIKKVALQIHDFSSRWAFVPFEDVKNDIHTVVDICNLGGMTLFVENIETLPTAYQNLLAEYLSSPRSLEEPLILTSSLIPLDEMHQYISSPTLLKDMTSVNLEVERAPLNSAVLRDVVELIFNRDETQDLH
jgi:hypothetical protein